MKLTKTHPLFSRFINLCGRLSPENLCCDGECSRAEVNSRHRQIMSEWRYLEKVAGFAVSEDEVWAIYLANR